MPQVLKIGQLAQATGVSAKTIRYYEQVGVLPPANRTVAGYRQYAEQSLHRLLFIRRARTLGWRSAWPLAAWRDSRRSSSGIGSFHHCRESRSDGYAR